MVLNGVVSTAVEETGDGGPLVTELGVGAKDSLILIRREWPVLHLRRQLVAPPKPTRLTGPSGNRFADHRPVPWPVLLYKILESLILFGAPGTLDPIQIRPR